MIGRGAGLHSRTSHSRRRSQKISCSARGLGSRSVMASSLFDWSAADR